jgi:hypothetical protein
MIADRQNLSAGLIRDGQVGNQTGLERLFPDIRLGRQAFANLLIAIEKRVRHGPLRTKTPPAIAITDGAFEPIIPVEFLLS